MNLAYILKENIQRLGEYVFLIFHDREITNVEIWNDSLKLKTYLKKQGVKKGDRVIVTLENSPEVYVSFQAVLACGATLVPVVPRLGKQEFAYIVKFVEPVACIACTKAAEHLEGVSIRIFADGERENWKSLQEVLSEETGEGEDVEDVSDDDVAVILFTSGTTGVPKGVMLTHRNIRSNVQMIYERQKPYLHKNEISLICVPLSHAMGLLGLVANFIQDFRKKSVLMEKFVVDEVLENIRKYQIRAFRGVPAMYAVMLQHPRLEEYVKSVETWGSGTAPLPERIQKEWQRRTGKPIAEGYGLSETTAVITANPERNPRPGSVGTPLNGVEIKIVDEHGNPVKPGETGEVIVRGPNVMKGYFKNPEETKKVLRDGWLYTGDLGYFDEDGYLHLVGRKKELIIRGGFNILPADVERVMLQHPDVLEVAVKGVPDRVMGEEIAAFVVLRPGSTLSEEELRQWMRERIAHNKVPRYIKFVDFIPKTPSGKVLRRKLTLED